MGGAEDEVAVLVRGWEGAIGECGGSDVAGCVGIAGGVTRARLLGKSGEGESGGERQSEEYAVHESRF
jgi:hypothetical protein